MANPSGTAPAEGDRAERWDGRTGPELALEWGVPRVEAYRTIGSTNDRAAELARVGAPLPTVVVAEEQTAGRGRRGGVWQSAPGAGVWMSIAVASTRAFAQLPLVVGVACARALDGTLEPIGLSVGVKWPNDLLVGERKVGGILCETGPHAVVIGVGVNVSVPVGGFDPGLREDAVSLEAVGAKALQRCVLAGAILSEVLTATADPAPFSSCRSELARRDALRDRRVETEALGPGVARGIDAHGALLLELPDGQTRAVHSGSVRLARTPERA